MLATFAKVLLVLGGVTLGITFVVILALMLVSGIQRGEWILVLLPTAIFLWLGGWGLLGLSELLNGR
jgi:hypothetical protein